MAKKSAANTNGTAKPRGKPWPKGVSGNPAGAPKRGESWAEIIKRVGEMTPAEAAQRSLVLAKELLKVGDGVTLKEAVVLRVYGALLFDPQPGLLNAFMERAEGKVAQTVNVNPSDALLAKMKELGLSWEDVRNDPLAVELFQSAGVAVGLGDEAAGGAGSEEDH